MPALKSFTKAEVENEEFTISLIAKHLNSSENIHYLGWDDATSVDEIKKSKVKYEEQFRLNEVAETLLLDSLIYPILECTFPARTEKMVMTLSKIHEYILENPNLKKAKVVLITGRGHLQVLENSKL